MLKLGKKEKSLLENSFKNIYERDENERTVLHYAIDAKTVRLLVEKGVNVNAADARGYTALHLAVTEKRLEIVRELIKSGANVNAKDIEGYTALHLAVTEKRLEIVRELIKSGADVNAEEYGNKCTPLHLACMVGKVEIVKELVEAGAEIEQADKFGMTAMDYAKNSKEVTEVLKKEIDRIERLFERQSGKSSMRG